LNYIRWQDFLASMNSMHRKHETQYTCGKNCGNIKNAILTPHTVPDVLIYMEHCFDEIQYVGKRVKWSYVNDK